MTDTYKENYKLIDWSKPIEIERKFKLPAARSNLPCPMIISDDIEVKSMVDGKTYSSKRALRQSYRANGYIEVGNEEQKIPAKPKPDRKSVRMAARKALSQVGIST